MPFLHSSLSNIGSSQRDAFEGGRPPRAVVYCKNLWRCQALCIHFSRVFLKFKYLISTIYCHEI